MESVTCCAQMSDFSFHSYLCCTICIWQHLRTSLQVMSVNGLHLLREVLVDCQSSKSVFENRSLFMSVSGLHILVFALVHKI